MLQQIINNESLLSVRNKLNNMFAELYQRFGQVFLHLTNIEKQLIGKIVEYKNINNNDEIIIPAGWDIVRIIFHNSQSIRVKIAIDYNNTNVVRAYLNNKGDFQYTPRAGWFRYPENKDRKLTVSTNSPIKITLILIKIYQ